MGLRIGYLDCQAGVSGSVLLGALCNLGFEFDHLTRLLQNFPDEASRPSCEAVQLANQPGCRVEIIARTTGRQSWDLLTLRPWLETLSISTDLQARTLMLWQCLLTAEGTIRGRAPADSGSLLLDTESLVCGLGTVLALAELGIEQVYASPLPLTGGQTTSQDGFLPLPRPVTLEILRQVQAPWRPVEQEGELVTPLGAAFLATFARFESPTLRVESVGYGLGLLPWPRCLRFYLGQLQTPAWQSTELLASDWVSIIETNLDNTSGEILGDLLERLLVAGALDVSYTPLQMKKNRPATRLSVIVSPELAETLAEMILRETGTLGVRLQEMRRLKAHRSQERLETPLGPLLVKVKRLGTRLISAAPEYAECRRLASEHNLPLEEVYSLAQQVIQATLLREPHVD